MVSRSEHDLQMVGFDTFVYVCRRVLYGGFQWLYEMGYPHEVGTPHIHPYSPFVELTTHWHPNCTQRVAYCTHYIPLNPLTTTWSPGWQDSMWSNQTEVATAAALEADAVAMEEEPEECTEHGGNAVPPFFPEKHRALTTSKWEI